MTPRGPIESRKTLCENPLPLENLQNSVLHYVVGATDRNVRGAGLFPLHMYMYGVVVSGLYCTSIGKHLPYCCLLGFKGTVRPDETGVECDLNR
jgi:hypothetical protein